jgi:hypothetical protein
MFAALLVQIGRQVAMEREHGKCHIFLHHPDDAVLDHAHDLHTGRHGLDAELVDAGADREEDFKVAIAREIFGNRPGDQIAHRIRIDRRRIRGERNVRKITRKSFGENRAAFCVGIEEKGHRASPS